MRPASAPEDSRSVVQQVKSAGTTITPSSCPPGDKTIGQGIGPAHRLARLPSLCPESLGLGREAVEGVTDHSELLSHMYHALCLVSRPSRHQHGTYYLDTGVMWLNFDDDREQRVGARQREDAADCPFQVRAVFRFAAGHGHQQA